MGGNLDASNLQVLGLNALREKIGSQWLIHNNVIKTVIESALGKALTAQDRYWRLDDELYVIAFADTDVVKTMQRTKAIGAAIVRQLVGTETETLVNVKALAGSLSRSIDGKIQFTQSHEDMAANWQSSPTGNPADQRATEVTFASLAKSMRSRAADDDLDALLQHSIETHKQRTGSALANKIARERDMRDALLAAKVAEEESLSLNYSLGFSPIWDVKKKAITAYAVIPHYEASTRWYYEHEVLGSIPSAEDVLDLDIACLRIAIRETAKSYTDSRAVLILSQIHYKTLASKTALAEVLQECARLPDFLRKYIAIQITGIPAEASTSILTNAVTQLHHYFRVIAGRTTLKTPLPSMKQFGFDIVSLMHVASEISAEETAAYQKFLMNARNHALPVVVEYVSTTAVANTFIELGMACISGHVIGDPMLAPQGVLLCEIDALPIKAEELQAT